MLDPHVRKLMLNFNEFFPCSGEIILWNFTFKCKFIRFNKITSTSYFYYKNKHHTIIKMPKNRTKYDKNRILSRENREILLIKQKSKCANTPGSNLRNIGNYECRLWKHGDGTFHEIERFEADHIVEYSLTKDNSISNMQLLCPSCHRVKTRNFSTNKPKKFNQTKSKSIKSESRNKNTSIENNEKTNIEEPKIDYNSDSKNTNNSTKPILLCPNCQAPFKHKQWLDDHIDKKVCENKKQNLKFRCIYCPGIRCLCNTKSLNDHIKRWHPECVNTTNIIVNNKTTKNNIFGNNCSPNKISHNNGNVKLNQVYETNNDLVPKGRLKKV